MTLVAAVQIQQSIFLIGDIAISGPKDYAAEVVMPTIGDASKIEQHEGRLVTLVQKLVLVNPKLAFGWSGKAMHALALIEQLRAKGDASSVSADDLDVAWSSLGDDAHNELNIVGFSLGTAGVSMYRRGRQTGDGRGTDYRAFAAGSGVPQFAQLLHDLVGRLPRVSPGAASVYCALTLSGSLLADEMKTSQSLKLGYGGAYEIICLVDGALTKLSNVLFFWWELQPGLALSLKRVTWLGYRGADLVLRTLPLGALQQDDGVAVPDVNGVFVIRSLDRHSGEHGQLEVPGFEGDTVVTICRVVSTTGALYHSRVDYQPHLPPTCVIPQPGGAEIRSGLDLVGAVRDDVERMLREAGSAELR